MKLVTASTREQTSPVYSLFGIPDSISATSENAPFWPRVVG